jgi:ATP-dependent DNA helicase RecG
MQFRIADLMRDQPLLPTVQRTADAMLREHPAEVERLIDRWVGNNTRYVDA